MRKLLVLIVGLLLVGPAWAQSGSGKGVVDHVTTAELAADPYDCTVAGNLGTRVYDTTLGYEVTCDGTDWRASGLSTLYEPVIDGNITINDGTPQINFDDTTALVGVDGTVDAITDVNCLTEGDCTYTISIDADAVSEEAIAIVGVAADDYDIYIGRGTTTTDDYVRITEGGLIYQYSDAPHIYFHDTNEAGGGDATNEGSISVGCATEDDCNMEFMVESGAGNYEVPLMFSTPDSGVTRINIGNADGPDYIRVSADTGEMTAIGDASIDATSAHEIVFFCGELGANTDEFFAGPNLVSVFTGAVPTDHTFASGTCDALGDTAVAAVENDIDEFQGYRVNGMFCQVSAAPGGADTVVTFVDDTANTAVTCTIAAAETSCASARGLWADVAADSQVAVGSLNGTDDENAEDIHCNVYLTWAG